jgi:hypothetical protein
MEDEVGDNWAPAVEGQHFIRGHEESKTLMHVSVSSLPDPGQDPRPDQCVLQHQRWLESAISALAMSG